LHVPLFRPLRRLLCFLHLPSPLPSSLLPVVCWLALVALAPFPFPFPLSLLLLLSFPCDVASSLPSSSSSSSLPLLLLCSVSLPRLSSLSACATPLAPFALLLHLLPPHASGGDDGRASLCRSFLTRSCHAHTRAETPIQFFFFVFKTLPSSATFRICSRLFTFPSFFHALAFDQKSITMTGMQTMIGPISTP
jgi:hypothetical protein